LCPYLTSYMIPKNCEKEKNLYSQKIHTVFVYIKQNITKTSAYESFWQNKRENIFKNRGNAVNLELTVTDILQCPQVLSNFLHRVPNFQRVRKIHRALKCKEVRAIQLQA